MSQYVTYIMYPIILVLVLVAGFLNIMDKSTIEQLFTLIVGTFLGLHIVPPFLQKQIALVPVNSPLVPQEENKT